MAISDEVKRQFFAHDGETSKVIRLLPVEFANPVGPNRRVGKPWTKEEHERFLEGLQMFPSGPWRRIATHVGTRTSRQTMTHAQKYRKRISRLLVSPVKLQSMASPPRSPSTEPIFEQCVFDDLDLEILSCLLADGEVTSDDSFSSCEESPCDVFEDLLDTAGGDHDMLHILTKLDVGDHHSVVL